MFLTNWALFLIYVISDYALFIVYCNAGVSKFKAVAVCLFFFFFDLASPPNVVFYDEMSSRLTSTEVRLLFSSGSLRHLRKKIKNFC